MSRKEDTCGARHTVRGTAAFALVLVLLWGAGAAAGKLDDVRDATSGGDDSADDSGDDDGDDGDGNGGGAGEELGEELADAAGEAFADALIDAASERAQNVRFEAYPYAHGASGWVVDLDDALPAALNDIARNEPGTIALTDRVSPLQSGALSSASLRLALDYGYDWDVLHRPTAALSLDTAAGLGARADFTSYVEPREGRAAEFLGIGSANLVLRVADSPRVAPYLGIGWRTLVDGEAWRNGVNGLVAVDVFPVRPLVVSAIAEGGNLGDAAYVHLRATVGALVRRVEVFAGYDAVVIRGGDDCVVFHGPTAGLRAWF
jgi:hypothetical protein